jgi:signal peptidase I
MYKKYAFRYSLLMLASFLAGMLVMLGLTAIYYSGGSHTGYVVTTAGGDGFIQRTLGDGPGLGALFDMGNEEKASPQDWISEDNIHVYDDRVVIDIKNPQWSTFTDTNSMDPVIDYGANAIQIVPKTYSSIQAGDIVSYESDYVDGIIIHRVIQTGFDNDGWYAIMKGDNNPYPDPGKVRFDQIRRIVVAIIY